MRCDVFDEMIIKDEKKKKPPTSATRTGRACCRTAQLSTSCMGLSAYKRWMRAREVCFAGMIDQKTRRFPRRERICAPKNLEIEKNNNKEPNSNKRHGEKNLQG
jgi:uncharacterized protein YaiL (DUF2058 family)